MQPSSKLVYFRLSIDKYYITSRSLENICIYYIRKSIQHNFKRDYLDHIYDFVETVKPL